MFIINWLLYSSKDANKIGLTIKGLSAFVPTIMVMFGLAQLNVSQDSVLGFIDAIAVLVTATLSVITAGLTVWGFVRKIISTFKGTNEVINS